MDLDEAAAVLYGGSPDEFVSRRTALAGQARAAKDRELAQAISRLRRPTRSAWLVNLLARQAGPELGQLLELGAALREAQASLAADDLRRLSRERSRAVAALARRAAALGAEQGYTASDAAVQEVGSTLQAALADPDVAAEVRAGRVAAAARYGGFGPMGWAGTRPEPVEGPEPAASTSSVSVRRPEPVEEPEPAPQVDEEQERRRAEAEDAWGQAQHELSEAEAAAEQATARADELAEALEDLRQRVRQTETAEREARNEARAARKRLGPVREAPARAQRHVEETRTQA